MGDPEVIADDFLVWYDATFNDEPSFLYLAACCPNGDCAAVQIRTYPRGVPSESVLVVSLSVQYICDDLAERATGSVGGSSGEFSGRDFYGWMHDLPLRSFKA